MTARTFATDVLQRDASRDRSCMKARELPLRLPGTRQASKALRHLGRELGFGVSCLLAPQHLRGEGYLFEPRSSDDRRRRDVSQVRALARPQLCRSAAPRRRDAVMELATRCRLSTSRRYSRTAPRDTACTSHRSRWVSGAFKRDLRCGHQRRQSADFRCRLFHRPSRTF